MPRFHRAQPLPHPDWRAAFRDAPEALAALPAHPVVCWTVSAGHDFRPLVFFSRPGCRALAERAGLPPCEAPVPDLFIHTSLPFPEGNDGLHGLPCRGTVYADRHTEIRIEDKLALHLDRDRVPYEILRAHHHAALDPLLAHDHDAALFTIRLLCLDTGHEETVRLLYLAMENLNAGDALLTTGPFDLRYLVATREGLGFGGCNRSILQHL